MFRTAAQPLAKGQLTNHKDTATQSSLRDLRVLRVSNLLRPPRQSGWSLPPDSQALTRESRPPGGAAPKTTRSAGPGRHSLTGSFQPHPMTESACCASRCARSFEFGVVSLELRRANDELRKQNGVRCAQTFNVQPSTLSVQVTGQNSIPEELSALSVERSAPCGSRVARAVWSFGFGVLSSEGGHW